MNKAIISGLIPQTELPEPYKKYGCNMRVMQAMGEIIAGKNLEHIHIVQLAEIARGLGQIGTSPKNQKENKGFDVYLYKPEHVANSAASFLGSSRKVWNSGSLRNGIPTAWNGEKTNYFNFIVLKLWQENMVDHHFTLADKNKLIIFDPTPNSKSARLFKICDGYLYKIL